MIQGRSTVWAIVCALSACADPSVDLDETELAATVCGKGPTVKGIDVSWWDGNVNWPAVRADGVEFAFIRVGDGVDYVDSRFDGHWAAAKEQGILRGAYQYFRPDEDPIRQADILLGKLAGQPGELPPVIDVEYAGSLSPAQVQASVKAWIDRVRPVIGREPIIYTGYYFWRDEVGAADMTGSPLWHAQYSTVQCPTIAPPWQAWAFWQFTDSGQVAGISGGVDVNRWNGTREELMQFASPRPCGLVGPEGGEVDNGDACFSAGGPPQYLRQVTDAGVGGDLVWTYTTASASPVSFAHWELVLAEAGRYRVEVSTPAPYARSTRARYVVTAAGAPHEVVIDQTASGGWQLLGELDFAAGAGQSVRVGDNTGEPASGQVQLAFDAVRLTRLRDPVPPPPDDEEVPEDDDSGGEGGCSAGGASGMLAGLGALGLALARRRRRRA